jgi:hypothetical protein
VVLNSEEQLAAALAKQELKRRQGDMKKVIQEAKKAAKTAQKVIGEEAKKVEKAVAEVEKQTTKAQAAAGKAAGSVTCGDKKAAVSATLIAQRAATAAESALSAGEAMLRSAQHKLLGAEALTTDLRTKEAELKRLHDAAAIVAGEEEEEQSDEDVEEVEAASQSLTVVADACAKLERVRGFPIAAWAAANSAAASALVTAASSVWLKAIEKERKAADKAAVRGANRTGA